MTTFLLSDSDNFNLEIKAGTFRQALKIARDRFIIRGKIRLITHASNFKTWKLAGTAYIFSLAEN